MKISYPTRYRLEVIVPQPLNETARFIALVMLIGVALAFGTPAPAHARVFVLLGMVLLAGLWSAYTAFCSEHVLFDRTIDRFVITRRTPLGEAAHAGPLQALVAVALEWGGGEDDRRLVILIDRTGARYAIPRRINTLSAEDQRALGQAIAEFLHVPLR